MISENSDTGGFTLPELLVTIGVVCLLLVGVGLFLHPKTYGAERNNSQRWVALAHLVQTITAYKADTGHFPPGLDATSRVIGSVNGELDLCKDLVPAYTQNLPFDPVVGAEGVSDSSIQVKNCATDGVIYSTGFSMSLSKSNLLTVKADNAEQGATIRLSHQY